MTDEPSRRDDADVTKWLKLTIVNPTPEFVERLLATLGAESHGTFDSVEWQWGPFFERLSDPCMYKYGLLAGVEPEGVEGIGTPS